MIDILILITISILIALLSIKFDWVSFLGALSSIIFIVGFFSVIFVYFYNYPKFIFKIIPNNKQSNYQGTDFYWLDYSITHPGADYDYTKIRFEFGKNAHIDNDLYSEMTGALNDETGEFILNKNTHVLNINTKNDDTSYTHLGSAGGQLMKIHVKRGTKKIKATVYVYLSNNSYDRKILSIFSPISKYVIKKEVEIDFSEVLNDLKDTNK